MAKIKLNDLLKGSKVDLTKIKRIDVIPTGRSTYYNNLGGLDSFVVDSANKTIKFLGTDDKGVETSAFKDGKDTLVARSNGSVVEYLSHLSDEPYKAQLQPFSITIPEGGDEGTYLLLAFKEYARTAYSDVFTGKEDSIEVTVADDAAPAPVLMTSFSLDKTEITGKVGDVIKVSVYDVAPGNTSNKGINVDSSDKTIATAVDNLDGTYSITLAKAGTTTAHWVAVDGGGAKKDLTITVSAA